ncbi:hypothetical protein WH47_05897 [Habropoda laboriosa]|uniref:Uncharacterized protein n=1 Tax=Habropoda laboriosa TaxID=597456 RepID=A0A0L7RKH3_9HYME|nr:hypothetical protein WH47_05897 [Habropoda laboriosa]
MHKQLIHLCIYNFNVTATEEPRICTIGICLIDTRSTSAADRKVGQFKDELAKLGLSTEGTKSGTIDGRQAKGGTDLARYSEEVTELRKTSSTPKTLVETARRIEESLFRTLTRKRSSIECGLLRKEKHYTGDVSYVVDVTDEDETIVYGGIVATQPCVVHVDESEPRLVILLRCDD